MSQRYDISWKYNVKARITPISDINIYKWLVFTSISGFEGKQGKCRRSLFSKEVLINNNTFLSRSEF